ncbi:MAG: hypothetical protein U0746_21485 [Gemmataceae bacterium]
MKSSGFAILLIAGIACYAVGVGGLLALAMMGVGGLGLAASGFIGGRG